MPCSTWCWPAGRLKMRTGTMTPHCPCAGRDMDWTDGQTNKSKSEIGRRAAATCQQAIKMTHSQMKNFCAGETAAHRRRRPRTVFSNLHPGQDTRAYQTRNDKHKGRDHSTHKRALESTPDARRPLTTVSVLGVVLDSNRADRGPVRERRSPLPVLHLHHPTLLPSMLRTVAPDLQLSKTTQ